MNESPRSWVLPEEPVPVRLMGTIWADTDGLHDDLDTPFGLDAWMDAVGIHHDTRPAAASRADVAWSVDVLNAAAARLPAAQLRIENNAFRRATPNPAVPAALAGVATEAVDLFGGTDADKLRACQAPGCVLYFVKTHPRREWCSIACGNRARAARHYHRRRQATAKPRTN
jgi:predicted RNA-binding Zn ribbon-like protein